MPEPIRITSLRDLDAAVAEHVFRQDVYRMDFPCWLMYGEVTTCQEKRLGDYENTFPWPVYKISEDPLIPWPVAAFSTDPVASFALETKMREEHEWYVQDLRVSWRVKLTKANGITAGRAVHASRFVAMCLASLAALGVELELVEG